MSLAIDVDTVSKVLLADGWHVVVDQTFSVDSYEYQWSGRNGVSVAQLAAEAGSSDPLRVHGGGQSGVCAAGFSFKGEDGSCLAGPLTAVVAVAYTP